MGEESLDEKVDSFKWNTMSAIIAVMVSGLFVAAFNLYVAHDKLDLSFRNHLEGDLILWRMNDNRLTEFKGLITDLTADLVETNKLIGDLEKRILQLQYQLNRNGHSKSSQEAGYPFKTPCPIETGAEGEPCEEVDSPVEVKSESPFKSLNANKPVQINP